MFSHGVMFGRGEGERRDAVGSAVLGPNFQIGVRE